MIKKGNKNNSLDIEREIKESIMMDNIITELMKPYGIWAIVALIVAGTGVWFAVHYQAKPGEKVSIVWGMVAYTKSESKNEPKLSHTEKDQSSVFPPTPDEGHIIAVGPSPTAIFGSSAA